MLKVLQKNPAARNTKTVKNRYYVFYGLHVLHKRKRDLRSPFLFRLIAEKIYNIFVSQIGCNLRRK